MAITPDAPEILERFADAFGIGYPLLADVGGHVIDMFGVRNHNIVANERQADGIPFPGHVLIDPQGVITATSFTGDLRHRPSGTVVVAEQFGIYSGPAVVIDAPELTATVSLSTGAVFGGQELAWQVVIDITPGWHVYGADAPPPYRSLGVRIDTTRQVLVDDTVQWPSADVVHLPALAESLPVHDGHLEGHGRLRVRWSPPPSIFAGLDDAVRRRAVKPGTYELAGTLTYQACTDEICVAPAEIAFTVPLIIEATVRTPPPAPR